MSIKLVTLFVVISLAFSIVPAVSADSETPTGTILVEGDILNVTAADFTFTAATLTGLTQTVTAPVDLEDWIFVDPSGTGEGWQVTISTSDFIGETDPSKKIPFLYTYNLASNYNFRMGIPEIFTTDGLTGLDGPVIAGSFSDVTTPFTYLDDNAATMMTAADDKGMGTYHIDPEFELVIPAETYEQVYVATLTVTLSATP